MVEFLEGWAAMADTWMVCAHTHDEALRRYRAAEMHGQPYPKRLPEWVSWACWLAALYVAAIGVLDGGARLNTVGFLALGALGMVASLGTAQLLAGLGFIAELAWIVWLAWAYPEDRAFIGGIAGAGVLCWLCVWTKPRFRARTRLCYWFAQLPFLQRRVG